MSLLIGKFFQTNTYSFMLTFFYSRITSHYFLFIFLLIVPGFREAACQAFITQWNTTFPGGNSNQIVIPATGSYHIDWVEVSNSSNTGSLNASGETTVTFSSPGIYEVSITGGLTAITFNNDLSKNPLKIISIEQWGNIAWATMENAFYGCMFLDVKATDIPDLSLVNSAKNMCYECNSITGPVGSWDVSSITDMSYMFAGIEQFNENLNTWDVSNVTNMEGLFYYTQTFNGDISSWDVSNVTNMRYMFGTTSFNRYIGDWNVSNVTTMEYMFNNAYSFNQDISGWDVSNVTNMSVMFSYANLFNQPIGSWNVSNVTEISWMFSGATDFNQDISAWDVSGVTNFYRMFSDAISFNQSIGAWNISQATNMGFMLTNSALSIANYDATLIAWNSQAVQSGVPLGADGLKYCTALSQRSNLINTKGWIITNDALDCSLGIEDGQEADELTVSGSNRSCYPNPWNLSADKILTVADIFGNDEVYATLTNVLGSVIYSAKLQPVNGKVEIPADVISGYEKGTYMLKITSSKEVYVSKILIE